METAIEAKDLRKSFKDTEVLKGVDFEAKQGSIFARSVPMGREKQRLSTFSPL